jgi:hypothetical protein
MLFDPLDNSILIGCGLWDRENLPHSNFIKDTTPGIVCRLERESGKILEKSDPLSNIVYPLVHAPWGGYFVGCRTGAAYLMFDDMETKYIGSYGRGVYGIAYSRHLDRFIIGGRDGTLYSLGRDWLIAGKRQVADNRLWNLCLDEDEHFLWSSCYNGRIMKINIDKGRTVFKRHLGCGATTLICRLGRGRMAVGGMKGKIAILFNGLIERIIDVESPVCFIDKLPGQEIYFATGYRGQIWFFDYRGRMLDSFVLDAKKNNPIWIAQEYGPGHFAFAWANGIIRVFRVSF